MAIRFNADDESISSVANLPTVTSFTMMAWVNFLSDLNIFGNFFGMGSSTTGVFYQISVTAAGDVLVLWNGSTTQTGSTITPGWYHMAITVAGTGAGQFLGYLDGVLDMTHAGNASVAAQSIVYGELNANWGRTDSRVAALKVWDAVLTADEIRSEMHTYVPKRWANLNRWTPAFPGATERLRDYSRNGNTWTENGTLSDEAGPPIAWDAAIPILTIPGAAAAGVSTIFNFPAPTLGGAPVTVGDGVSKLRHLNIPAGEFTTDPFWLVPDSDADRAQRVDSLPGIVTFVAGTISASSSEP